MSLLNDFYLKSMPALQTIAATAGNVATNLTTPAFKRWLCVYGRITLVCDATVATRNIYLSILYGSNYFTKFLAGGNATASQTKVTSFNDNNNSTVNAIAALDDTTEGLSPFVLFSGFAFRIQVNNGVAGDSYSGYVMMCEVRV